MVRRTDRCKIAVLVLSLALMAPSSPAEAFPLDAASRLAGWLTAWLADVGCSWDPGGCPGGSRPTPPPDSIDVGCSWDPNGCPGTRRAAPPAESVDVGCSMDPGGCPGTGQATPPLTIGDVGCSMDPDGVCGDRG